MTRTFTGHYGIGIEKFYFTEGEFAAAFDFRNNELFIAKAAREGTRWRSLFASRDYKKAYVPATFEHLLDRSERLQLDSQSKSLFKSFLLSLIEE